jgi:hypothetical protein
MNLAKVSVFGLMVALVLTVGAQRVMADDATTTITGKASCGGCSGVAESCCLMLTDADGARWVLIGDSPSIKAAFEDRHKGKSLTATLIGKPTEKKGKDGKDYKEAKAKDVKVVEAKS